MVDFFIWQINTIILKELAILALLAISIPIINYTLVKIVLKKIRRKNYKLFLFIRTGRLPSSILFVILFAHILLKEIFTLVQVQVSVQFIIYFCLFIWIWSFIKRLESYLVKKVRLKEQESSRNISFDSHAVEGIAKVIRLILLCLLIISILQTVGIDLSALLAIGGVSGMVIGFAAKDLIANFLGGMIIYIEKPFKPGQLVKCDNPYIFGVVENIGWRRTLIRTLTDRSLLQVPNGIFMSANIENCSIRMHRRVLINVGVAYQDIYKIKQLTANIRSKMFSIPGVDTNDYIYVNFNEFDNSSLTVRVIVHTRRIDYNEYVVFKENLLYAVFEEVDKLGMTIAYPTRTIYVGNQDDSLPEESINKDLIQTK